MIDSVLLESVGVKWATLHVSSVAHFTPTASNNLLFVTCFVTSKNYDLF